MRLRITVLLLSFLSSIFIFADNQGIDSKLLKELRNSVKKDGYLKLASNALSGNSASNVLLDREKVNFMDKYYSHKLPSQKITNQKSTGRCWMFAGLNILRAEAAKKLNLKDIEFSHNYLFFYDKLEKSNMFLRAVEKTKDKKFGDRYLEFIMKHACPDGGQWIGMVELVKKYGVVPSSVMPETYSSEHSSLLNRTLAMRLKKAALAIRSEENKENIEKIRIDTLKDIYKILTINLGSPVESFTWRYTNKNKKILRTKEFTPQNFYKEIVGINLDDYYVLCSVPVKEYNKVYEIDLDKAVYEKDNMKFVNIEMKQLRDIAKNSILGNKPVWFGCDVGKESIKKGYMIMGLNDYGSLYGMDFNLSRKESFLVSANNPTHAMVFTGVDIEGDKINKWLVENSWGRKFGHQGYYHMHDKWFAYYVQSIVVHKKYIPAGIFKIFKEKSTILPPWDPMYKAVTVNSN